MLKPTRTVGVIGAGISGLACAQALQNSGVRVTVLERSQGVGGRVATRRGDSGATFDHGAQHFTVRDPAFQACVDDWCKSGTVSLWQGRIVVLRQGVLQNLHEPRERYVGVPGMNAIAKSLAMHIDVRTCVTAETIWYSDGAWHVRDCGGAHFGPFDFLVMAAPPLQTAKLLAGQSDAFENLLSTVVMQPCWAVLLQMFERLPTEFDAAFVHDSPLSWIARNNSKPERQASECWILHASPAWSRDHLEDPTEFVTRTLVTEFWQALAQTPQSLEFTFAHRWRYALPQEPLSQRFLLDSNAKLGACGDWCGGARVEGAYRSGVALAKAVLEMNQLDE